MANNVKEMSEQEIREFAEKYCRENGFEIIDMKELPHSTDSYLRQVLAHSESKQEYATWLFNVECGGLHHGHYFNYSNNGYGSEYNALVQARRDFMDR